METVTSKNQQSCALKFQNADYYFMLEDYDKATILLEQAVACYQYVAHPKFDLKNVSMLYWIIYNDPDSYPYNKRLSNILTKKMSTSYYKPDFISFSIDLYDNRKNFM